jgi:hypothetical protein
MEQIGKITRIVNEAVIYDGLTVEDADKIEALLKEIETEQLRLHVVVKSLPTDDEIYSEGCKYVRKIEQPNRQPLITLRQTFKAGAMFVRNNIDN